MIFSYTQHALRAQPILLQLPQPFVLDSMRLLLWDKDDRVYSYEINVSTDLVNWKTIARKQNERSWQSVVFERLPVVFVRIMGIRNSANDVSLKKDVIVVFTYIMYCLHI